MLPDDNFLYAMHSEYDGPSEERGFNKQQVDLMNSVLVYLVEHIQDIDIFVGYQRPNNIDHISASCDSERSDPPHKPIACSP